MARTAKQELVERIERLNINLREYKKAQDNLSGGTQMKALAEAIKQTEREISELQIKLEVMVAIGIFFPQSRRSSYALTPRK